ncbi:hypothetical protein B566_EDAN006666 [Ephemera danica]|nr:hypothetical protein B566_EDAN006666 [Ephemera danica]
MQSDERCMANNTAVMHSQHECMGASSYTCTRHHKCRRQRACRTPCSLIAAVNSCGAYKIINIDELPCISISVTQKYVICGAQSPLMQHRHETIEETRPSLHSALSATSDDPAFNFT